MVTPTPMEAAYRFLALSLTASSAAASLFVHSVAPTTIGTELSVGEAQVSLACQEPTDLYQTTVSAAHPFNTWHRIQGDLTIANTSKTCTYSQTNTTRSTSTPTTTSASFRPWAPPQMPFKPNRMDSFQSAFKSFHSPSPAISDLPSISSTLALLPTLSTSQPQPLSASTKANCILLILLQCLSVGPLTQSSSTVTLWT